MKVVIKKRDSYPLIYYLLWMVYNIAFFLCQQTELQYMYDTSSLYQSVSLVVGASLIFLFLITGKFNMRELIIYCVVAAIIGVCLITLHDKYLIVALGFVLLGRKIDTDQLVRVDLVTKLFVLISVLSMCFLGFIQNYSRYINGSYKQALGFSHPNMLSNIVFIILLEWMYIRYNKLKVWEYVLILVLAGVVWKIAASRTSAYTFIAIYICMVISKIFPKLLQNTVIVNLLALLPTLITVISFYLIKLYDKGNLFAIALNEIMTKRIKQASIMLNQYGLSMFGQFINTRGTRALEYSTNAVYNVDMSYIAIPVRYGIFVLLLLLIGYFLFIKKTAKVKNNKLLLVTIYFVVLGFAETYFYRIQYNFTMAFLLMYAMNDKGQSRGYICDENKK